MLILICLLILVALIPVCVGLIAWTNTWKRVQDEKKSKRWGNKYWMPHPIAEVISVISVILIGLSLVIIIGGGITWGISSLNTFNTVQEMEAFRDGTLASYQYTIDATESVVIDVSGTRDNSITDFTYNEQGKTVSERIKELRDKAEWYNSKLKKYRAWNDIFIISGVVADIPEDWSYIILGEE